MACSFTGLSGGSGPIGPSPADSAAHASRPSLTIFSQTGTSSSASGIAEGSKVDMGA